MYILYFFNDTKKKVIYEESTYVFHRNIMYILLEQFEDDLYIFDSISTIILNDFSGIIKHIPCHLKKLEILYSEFLMELPQFPNSIERIIINAPRIRLSENFTKYPNLKELKLYVSTDIDSTYPPELVLKHVRTGSWIQHPSNRPEIEKRVNGLVNNKQPVHTSSVSKNIYVSPIVMDTLTENYSLINNPMLDLFIDWYETNKGMQFLTYLNPLKWVNISKDKSLYQTLYHLISSFRIHVEDVMEDAMEDGEILL